FFVTEWIDPKRLDDSERKLRQFFKARRDQLERLPSEGRQTTIDRLERLAVKALDATDAAWWSDRKHYIVKTRPHSGRSEGTTGSLLEPGTRVGEDDVLLEAYFPEVKWQRLDLAAQIEQMVNDSM